MRLRPRIIIGLFLLSGWVQAHAGSIPAALIESDKSIWSDVLKKNVMRPPCCGACPIFTMAEAKELWPYLTGQSRTSRGEQLWKIHHIKLLRTFKELAPERYRALYGSTEKEN